MNADFKTIWRISLTVAALLLAVTPVLATSFQQQVNKELDERLLYLLSQRQSPPVEVIQQLLDKGARVNQPVTYKTARVAIEKKDAAKVKELLAKGVDANYEYAIDYTHTDIKRTVLILAAKMDDPAIVQMLLAAGANPNAKGLIYGSEHGLEYGTALQAAKNPEVISLLRKATISP